MIEPKRINSAADELLAAAMLGDGWENGLQQLADAADAGGASIVRIHAGHFAGHISSVAWAQSETAIMTGHAPPSQLRLYPAHAYGSSFCIDHDVWTDDKIRRDPYYQEFLRPRGVLYHAKLRLWSEPDARVTLTLKRRVGLGPYERADVAVLDSVIPELQMAFGLARRVLDAEASGMLRVVLERGGPAFELDALGRVLRTHGTDPQDVGVTTRNRRLLVAERIAQPALDRAIAKAAGEPHQPAIVAVASPSGARIFLQVIPVVGRARDVFLATAAMVVVISPSCIGADRLPHMIAQAFGLTEREAQIAALLAAGKSLSEMVKRLGIGIGTVRNHVKCVFAKTGTRRQGELIALLRALQP